MAAAAAAAAAHELEERAGAFVFAEPLFERRIADTPSVGAGCGGGGGGGTDRSQEETRVGASSSRRACSVRQLRNASVASRAMS